MHLIAECYEYDCEQEPSEEDLEQYDYVVAADKQNQRLREGKRKGDVVEVSPEQRAAYQRVKEHRKHVSYCNAGFPWRCRIVNDETGDTVFEIPRATGTRWHAARYGERFIARYKKHRRFDQVPLGPAVAGKPVQVPSEPLS